MSKQYYVYIMTNRRRGVLYTGVTSNLEKRVAEHRTKVARGFTRRYNIVRLVCFEVTGEVYAAIEREKQIKCWVRRRKIAAIESANPQWHDLSVDW